MWGKTKKANIGKIQTLIGQETSIQGNVSFKNGLHLDGCIEGNIIAEEDSEAVAIISEQGKVFGNVKVPTLILNGTVNGDVHVSERIELHEKAKVNGDVYYNLMEMSVGAEINGKMVHKKPHQKPLLEHTKSNKLSTDVTAKPIP